MSLPGGLDKMLGGLLGGQGGASSNIISQVLGMLGGGGQGGGSGLQSMLSKLSEAGLGDQAQSWVSKGPNQPVSAQQLQQALGPQVNKIAETTGTSPDQVAQQMSTQLPKIVDGLTPDGTVPP